MSAVGIGAAGAAGLGKSQPTPASKGRLKQGVARWCFNKWSIEELCANAAKVGLVGIDLVEPKDWPVLKKYGLIPTMVSGGGTIADGLNRKEFHDKIIAELRENIARAAEAGVPNVITFSGNRRGMSDEEGLENCVAALNRIKGFAEEKGVTINLELLNSKVNHKDYMCDHTAWGVEVCKRVNSPRVKLLYDIYHMQIMEGDVIRTIRENIQWIGHFHTAGNPGRNEIDETQELNYRAIAKAIADLNFTGYFSHEFTPRRDPLESLRQAVEICTV
ncbi:MAG TPA: TIM barrel protein [Bryobacteraceae bacterium]|nr:TIM barrel protein [Bryobacteraceae bacterium]HOL72026.1 TIM barrel protein [Bryobacteraceae bacterium]HOQ46720.1 TIM barrel protein [Bryobacteraceae bacterium]HPQ15295.1 TIM barrel protein [Bryobacteraceae bacterium]HPU72390.1 TIM barrel protein [Bryobacteraceae bacterium]